MGDSNFVKFLEDREHVLLCPFSEWERFVNFTSRWARRTRNVLGFCSVVSRWLYSTPNWRL